LIKKKTFTTELAEMTLANKPCRCIENRRGEAEEMKKALLCDTLNATAMVHQCKTGVH